MVEWLVNGGRFAEPDALGGIGRSALTPRMSTCVGPLPRGEGVREKGFWGVAYAGWERKGYRLKVELRTHSFAGEMFWGFGTFVFGPEEFGEFVLGDGGASETATGRIVPEE